MDHLSEQQFWRLKDGELGKSEVEILHEHLSQCTRCQEQWAIILKLEEEVLSIQPPEVSPGFALKVTGKVREMEANKTFSLAPFRIFRIGLAFSFALLAVSALILLQGTTLAIDFSKFESLNLSHYLVGVLCLIVVFLADKSLARLLGAKPKQ